jgi:hypothetical protein
MKKLNILFTAIVLMSGLTTKVIAQTLISPSPTASVTLRTPIAISNTSNMNFGNITAGSTIGTVVLSPSGSRIRTGGVTLPAVTGTVSVASFLVTGDLSSTYSITLPATSYIITNGSYSMTVNTFVSSPSGTGTLSSVGQQTLTVGATLNIGVNQAGGRYTNATGFNVSVNYN